MITRVRHIPLPAHELIAHQLRIGLEGLEHTVVFGPRGVGKTATITTVLQAIDDEEQQRLDGDDSGDVPRATIHLAAGQMRGVKTSLIDLHEALAKQELAAGLKRGWTPTQLITQCVELLRITHTQLLVVDEAQHLNVENIEHLRQVADKARAVDHPFGLVLIGDERLPGRVAETGQRGERFATEVHMQPLPLGELRELQHLLHPRIATLRESMPHQDWGALCDQLLAKTGRSMRRIATVWENALTISEFQSTPLDIEMVRAAIIKMVAGQ